MFWVFDVFFTEYTNEFPYVALLFPPTRGTVFVATACGAPYFPTSEKPTARLISAERVVR